jgi:hypothetical protein
MDSDPLKIELHLQSHEALPSEVNKLTIDLCAEMSRLPGGLVSAELVRLHEPEDVEVKGTFSVGTTLMAFVEKSGAIAFGGVLKKWLYHSDKRSVVLKIGSNLLELKSLPPDEVRPLFRTS